MKTTLHDKVERGDTTWLVVTVSMEPGEEWKLPPNGKDTGDGYEDTSDHVGAYFSGRFLAMYDKGNVVCNGPCGGSAQQLTGSASRYPNGEFLVRCEEAGDIVFVLPRGEEVPLGYIMLQPSQVVTINHHGWAVRGDTHEVFQVDEGDIRAPSEAPLLVFWEA